MAAQAAYGAPLATAAAQWYFSDDDLANTPSQTGSDYSASPYGKTLSAAEEQERRQSGCNFIHNVVQRLKMHQYVASTACVLFHRFYMRQSLPQYHHYETAGACVLVASKIEENKRGFKEIAHACAFVGVKGNVHEAERSRDKWERLLRRQEIVLLENCCFDLDIAHPYAFIDALAEEFAIPVYVVKAATAHVNDALRTTVCLRHRPEVVAVAALYLAIAIQGHAFSGSLLASRLVALPPAPEAEGDVHACMLQMLAFYDREAEAEREHARFQKQQQQQQHRLRT
ncbi:hypothetical protein H4R18_000400 [Coemansia javaensis]|uniref:Cyclin-like domain-containing protein n=1 Tax=Coemansia javaensis TaxID=2761396 RepID=A0A9W8HPS8_9FUNG|nr:hypothetical protein H4R18_000400 [Coemansia javaensis]